jgi:uncharacterized protein (TIGR02996 family)
MVNRVTSDEAAFLAGIRAEPRDDLRRLVYADWCDEQGTDDHRAKAEYLRLEVHVSGLADDHPERDGFILKLRAAAELLPVEWKTAVAKVPIENCNVRWRFQCPKKWSELEVIDPRMDSVRFCTACRKEVHFCDSVEVARDVAETFGDCVAIDRSAIRTPGDMDLIRGPAELDTEVTMGRMAPDDFNPGAPGFTPPPPAQLGLLRRLWRRLTGQ